MNFGPGQVIDASWIVFVFYWFVSSFSAKPIERGEGSAGIARRVFTAAIGYLLLFRADDSQLGIQSERFLPRDLWVASSPPPALQSRSGRALTSAATGAPPTL
jgi:hypothetical protein